MQISNNNTFDVIIIGSGLAGLSSGLHFAKTGFNVLVLEKQPKVGGYCQSYLRGDYNFDVSLHVLAGINKGHGLNKILNHLQVLDKLTIQSHNPMFSSVFPDQTYTVPAEIGPATAYLKKQFPNDHLGIDNYTNIIQKIIDENGQLFWNGTADFSNFYPAKFFKTTYFDLLAQCTDNPKLHGLLGQLWQSTGLPNKRCAAVWGAEVFGSHLLSGNFYIKGGGQELSKAMVQTLRQAGCTVKTNSLVSNILLKNKKAYGVTLENGNSFFAPIIISNANPYQTYFDLVGKEQLSKPYIYRLEHMEPSCSLLTFYLGLDCPASKIGINHHTQFINHRYDNDEAFDLAMNEQYDSTDYMISDYTDPSGTNHPKGHGIIQILEVADGKKWTKISRADYTEKKKRVTETILDKVSKRFPKLQSHIKVLEMGTPRTMMLATRNKYGAVYGFAQTPNQADNYRFDVKSLFDGLYFTGAWCRGGAGGYMGTIINGRVAFNHIMAREQLKGRDKEIIIPKFNMKNGLSQMVSEKQMPTSQTTTIQDKSMDFSNADYTFFIDNGMISPLDEIKQDACIRLMATAANQYLTERLNLINTYWPGFDAQTIETTFFQMRFVFVPFATVHFKDAITVSVACAVKEAGKVEFTLNVHLQKNNKKLANAGGRTLVRKV